MVPLASGERTRPRIGWSQVKSRTSTAAVVVGAGQAGLTLSYYLARNDVPHVVLERDRAFSAWRDRWDGFRANTPNWMNTLPILEASRYPGDDSNGFATREELVDYFDECLRVLEPPLRTGVEVEQVRQRADGLWEVETAEEIIETPSVAICVGAMSTPRLPSAAAGFPASIPQLHSVEYRNPEQIGTGSVLVVGSGSSGMQISDLLCRSGRFDAVHLSVSKVMVLPDTVLGIQVHRFIHFFGLFDVRTRSPLGRLMFSNLESRGDPIRRPAPKDLSRRYGVVLHERLAGTSGDTIRFADGESLVASDLTVVWCTGFRSDFSFVQPLDPAAILDPTGFPIHIRGVVEAAPGLYYVGLRYQHTVASHDIYGVGKDARYVAEQIRARSSNEVVAA
jgi:putative flavoprotein involved in K+ transport